MHVGLEDEDEEAPQKAEQQRKRARNTSQQGNAGKRKASKLASSPADEDDADGDMHAAEGNEGATAPAAAAKHRVTSHKKVPGKRSEGRQPEKVSGDEDVELEDEDPENGEESTAEKVAEAAEPKAVSKFKRTVGHSRLGVQVKDEGRGGGNKSRERCWCTQVCCLLAQHFVAISFCGEILMVAISQLDLLCVRNVLSLVRCGCVQ